MDRKQYTYTTSSVKSVAVITVNLAAQEDASW